MPKQWIVSEVARMAHVTVRTLHHYDDIGLLHPSERTDAGYRLYSRAELERLHLVLLYRELGFSLEAIGQLLDEPALDRAKALRAQRDSRASTTPSTPRRRRSAGATRTPTRSPCAGRRATAGRTGRR